MKKILSVFLVIFLAIIVYFGVTSYPKLDLISGFSAKSIASAHFIDGRDLPTIEAQDNNIDLVKLAKNTLFLSQNYATSSVYGLKQRKAIFRPGLGAVLIDDTFDCKAPYLTPKRDLTSINLPYPLGNLEPKDTLFPEINYNKLQTGITKTFGFENAKNKNTRAVVVLYKNKLVGEKYANGFTKDNKFLGWSMTKSLTATYFGILQKQGKIDLNERNLFKEWLDDDRKNITINDLLHMNSGLKWEEDYTKISDVTKMLFLDRDMTQSQINQQLIGKPNESWNYSSGTSNVLSGIIRNQFGTHQEYLDFWYSSLIDKIGMHSMLVETDMNGTFVGSSYAWATARDWAKFGLLYLNKGNWNGQQIFDSEWTHYVATPTNGSDGVYGGHFWLNAGGKLPDVPKDMYSCNGFQGQRVFIIPSMDLVVVRMGVSEGELFDFNAFLSDILIAFKK